MSGDSQDDLSHVCHMSGADKPLPASLQKAISIYLDGANTLQVGQYLGVSQRAATALLRGAGVRLRPPTVRRRDDLKSKGGYTVIDDEYPEITEQYLAELSHRWAQKTPGIVSKALEDAGLI